MYSLSSCVMYKNLDAKIRVEEDAVYLTIADEEMNSVSMTLNPIQVLTLAKYLYVALSEIKLENIYKSELFGNLTAQIDNANIDMEKFEISEGCYGNEFYYYDDDELQVANG